MTDLTHHHPGLHHTADFFDSEEELGHLVARSVKEGVDRSESVLVTVPEGAERQTRSLLGSVADSVHFESADNRYARPATAIHGLARFLTGQLRSGHSRIRSIGAVPFTSDDLPEWVRYEAAVNEVLAKAPLTGVCFYDRHLLTDRDRASVEETHPHLGSPEAGTPSKHYLEPHRLLEDLPAKKLEPGRHPDLTLHHVADPRRARTTAADLAPSGRGDDVAMVVHELTTLALQTGTGSPQVRMWREPHGLVVQVTGSPAFEDPFAGWRPPQAEGNPSLWIARQLADDFTVDPSGTVPVATVVFSD